MPILNAGNLFFFLLLVHNFLLGLWFLVLLVQDFHRIFRVDVTRTTPYRSCRNQIPNTKTVSESSNVPVNPFPPS